jgi:ABC-2 type transport system permease protein
MIRDIGIIIDKELKELLFQRGHERGNIIRLLILIGFFGVLLPIQNGAKLLTSMASLVFWSWIPYIMISGITADTFAGERERHTLETLLVSRLSDRAILFGKLGAVISYGWGLTIITILVNLVTLNLAFWQGHIMFYPASLFGLILLVSLLVAFFTAGLGIIISLRSTSARSAQQTMSVLMFALMIPLFMLTLLPANVLAGISTLVSGINPSQFIGVFVATLFFIDVGLILFSISRFRREKLIGD